MRKIRNIASAILVAVIASGCAATDLEFGKPLLPVIEPYAFNASGGHAAYDILGTVHFQGDMYPNDPASRRLAVIYYLTQDAKRDFPQADAIWLMSYTDAGHIGIGVAQAVRRK